MSRRYDVAVIGAGPAGANAAIAATERGLSCIVVDEAQAAGGQIYRAPASPPARRKAEIEAGDELRDRLGASSATLAFGRRVWHVESGFAVHTVGADGLRRIEADRLIVAAGTSERVVPFPGWTTPGVIGLAAATILLKSQAMLPGRRTLVAGRGPLLAAVAAGILDLGGEVVAVVDHAPRSAWLRALPQLASRLDLLARGVGWWARLQARGVPIFHEAEIASVVASGDVLQVHLSRATEGLECDAVAVGDGLTPATEITRLLGARHRYDAGMGGIVPELDRDGRGSVEGLYACGDGAGVRGAAAAAHAGRLAGLAAAQDSGRRAASGSAEAARRSLARARRFGAAMAGMMAPRAEDIERVAPETIVCRCEDVARSVIDAAIDAGAVQLDQLKAWTRCGMGPCQGRMCGETVRALVAARTGNALGADSWTVRPPIRPVPIAELIGDFCYYDIPIPKAAPL